MSTNGKGMGPKKGYNQAAYEKGYVRIFKKKSTKASNTKRK
jgi:hypothetical protein